MLRSLGFPDHPMGDLCAVVTGRTYHSIDLQGSRRILHTGQPLGDLPQSPLPVTVTRVRTRSHPLRVALDFEKP